MRTAVLCFALILLSTPSLAKAEPAVPATQPASELKFVDIFDGKTLDGWKIVGCEAEVQDGCIFIKGGNGVVRTIKEYKDFVLEIDWKALKDNNWDSGVYFRCGDPPKGKPWPPQYQCNLRKGMEGNVDELKAKSKGLCKDKEWNHFRLTVVGTTCSLEINGQPAWKADGLKDPTGFIHLQAEVPGGGQFLFKNIRVAEIAPAK